MWGAVAQWLERATDNQVVAGSNPADAVWKLAISFTPLCQCLSEETLKAVGPFYLVSMPGEVKDPTSLHWKCVTCRGLHHPLLETTRHVIMDHTGNKSYDFLVLSCEHDVFQINSITQSDITRSI